MRPIAVLALSLTALVASACHHGDTPTGLAQTEALLETAPALSFDSALDELGLSATERHRLGGLASELHTAMLSAHDALGRLEGVEESGRAAAHDQVQAQLEDVHVRHKVFVESMTPEQQSAFAAAIHRQMAEAHGDHDGMDHDGMGHEGMDHEGMEHEGTDHEGMDHDAHHEDASGDRHHPGGSAAH